MLDLSTDFCQFKQPNCYLLFTVNLLYKLEAWNNNLPAFGVIIPLSRRIPAVSHGTYEILLLWNH